MNRLFLFLSIFSTSLAYSQPTIYTVANAHSHNDYEQPVPLLTAYNEAFGSNRSGYLLVQWRNTGSAQRKGTGVAQNPGRPVPETAAVVCRKEQRHIYADANRHLQFMIDLKTDGRHYAEQTGRAVAEIPGVDAMRYVADCHQWQPA